MRRRSVERSRSNGVALKVVLLHSRHARGAGPPCNNGRYPPARKPRTARRLGGVSGGIGDQGSKNAGKDFTTMQLKSVLLAASAVVALGVSAASAGTLDDVKARGTLNCVVNAGLAGFGAPNDKGEWTGLDVDYLPRGRRRGVRRRQQGQVHPARPPRSASPRCSPAKSTCWRATRPGRWAATPSSARLRRRQLLRRPGLHGPQGRSACISALELTGATICVQTGTTTELNLADYFRANKLEFKPVVFEKADEGRRRLRLRPLRRLHDGRLGPRGRAHRSWPTRPTTSSCRRSSPRSRSALPSARATTSGSTSCAGPTTR